MPQSWKHTFLTTMASLHGRPLLRFFVSRLPDAAEAPDMVQEVYLRLLRLNRPDLIQSPEAYLYTIAANIAREQRLKLVTRPANIALDDAPAEALPADTDPFAAATPESAALNADRLERLQTVLMQLSPKARACLVWHRRDGLTYKEIGARLGISTNMVKKYLSQAMAHCHQRLGAEQGGPERVA
ncbi:RNA polymerase sigma factor [Luteimonas saliphila]|uniref:RNA polymerase sigma factor n=1 Tax=Luteimonas saliphila TaxID=2804919 RepID=UPI00192D6D97|nr:sigma-70 family RNA polymerase sigma factor [Luteimonas saliphila]